MAVAASLGHVEYIVGFQAIDDEVAAEVGAAGDFAVERGSSSGR
jgi:hypothetical protein